MVQSGILDAMIQTVWVNGLRRDKPTSKQAAQQPKTVICGGWSCAYYQCQCFTAV